MLNSQFRSRSAFPAGLLLFSVFMAAVTQAGDGIVGQSRQTFSAPSEAPLHLPTAVAVADNGSVFVADGVNDRVVVFDPSGELRVVISAGGELPLRNPTGVKIDRIGRLWIADTGNHRVLRYSPALVIEAQIDPPRGDAAREADVTDIAITPDGGIVWIVDNDNHRLLRYDAQTTTWRVIGHRGEALGLFQYPFAAAAVPNGDLVITDVINARAQLFNAAGDSVATLGTYGVDAGEFYRPSGTACDRDGNIWIADCVTGVVQVFRPNGSFLGALIESDGKPMHFASPMGLAFDTQNNLYVTELLLNQIRKVSLTAAAGGNQPTLRKPQAEGGQHARGCTICHLDWMPAFDDGKNSTLLSNPAGTPQDPMVSRAETCLSCHNGLVADSRRRIWQDHGHRTGTPPPVTMRVPVNLPLIDGKLACRTCHSAHRAGNPDTDIGKSVFLRVENTVSELCKSCHTDKTRGEQFGTHPVTGMPWPVPQVLIDAGARLGPNPRELTCQVCHTPHGAKFDSLLVIGAENNQLCLTCHDQLRPGMFRPGGPREHPLAPKANLEQTAAVKEMGTRLGPDGQLLCLSCHKLHHGKTKRFMLADELTDGQMCLRCHSDRQILVNSAHDLRTNHPDERNRLGMTPMEGGPCSACHLFHRFARQLTPSEVDPAGQCTSCHQPGQCAEAKLPGSINHPLLRCTECHNPHQPSFGKFLRAQPEDVCTMCHSDKTKLFAGPHDAHDNEAEWCRNGSESTDRCLACHRPHGDENTKLFRVAPLTANGVGPDGACLACHPKAAWASDAPIAATHPQQGALLVRTELPLVPGSDADAARVGCRTCHNPHNGAKSAYLLRSGDGPPETLCITCHKDMPEFVNTMHAPAHLAAKGLIAGECRPCHQMHADPASIEPRLMFSAKLIGIAGSTPGLADDRYCIGCHAAGGAAPVPAIYSHPIVPMTEPPGAADQSTIHLYGEDGMPDPQGRITCRTCHTPHGVNTDLKLLRAAVAESGSISRGLALEVRKFITPNVCSTCHGADALRRFLYFHDPRSRQGPLMSPGTVPPS